MVLFPPWDLEHRAQPVSQHSWGTFEIEDAIHVIPCTSKGLALSPHLVDRDCFCEPLIDPETFSNPRVVWKHNCACEFCRSGVASDA